jgi:RNA polymerase sigma factor (sigma-70 family)
MPAELFEEIKANNHSKATVIIVAQYDLRLRAYLRRFTSDDVIINDAVQEAYIVAIRKTLDGSFPEDILAVPEDVTAVPENVTAVPEDVTAVIEDVTARCEKFFNYLVGIASNKLMAIFKERKRSREAFMDDMSTEKESLSEESLSEDVINRLNHCLGQLNERQKKILIALHVDNLKHEEIAGLLNITISTSEKTASRAREKMRECLKLWLNQG